MYNGLEPRILSAFHHLLVLRRSCGGDMVGLAVVWCYVSRCRDMVVSDDIQRCGGGWPCIGSLIVKKMVSKFFKTDKKITHLGCRQLP